MAEKKAAKQEQTFEQALERLDVIVKEMEEGSLSLETMMAHFEEGMETVKFCTDKLNEVEKKIELLVDKNGELSTVPFEPEA